MPLKLEHRDEVLSHASRRQKRKGAVHGLFDGACKHLLAQETQSNQKRLPCL